MRFVVLFFGFLGVLMTGFMGVMFFSMREFVDLLRGQGNEHLIWLAEFIVTFPSSAPFEDTGIFLLLAAVYGLLGTILAFARCGWQGALMMLLPVLFTGLMNPISLGFSGMQAFAALLSFFVFPLPLEPEESKAKADDEEDEDDEPPPKPKPKPKPKAKPKRPVDDDED